MFMWKYFILYVGVGAATGYTFNIRDERYSMLSYFGAMAALLLVGWNFATFGFFWGIFSIGEVILGFIAGSIIKNRSS